MMTPEGNKKVASIVKKHKKDGLITTMYYVNKLSKKYKEVRDTIVLEEISKHFPKKEQKMFDDFLILVKKEGYVW